jgi:hypothetical protein
MPESFVPLVSVETAHARLLVTVLWPNLTGELRRETIDAIACRLTEDRCEHPGVFASGYATVYCGTCDHEIPAGVL